MPWNTSEKSNAQTAAFVTLGVVVVLVVAVGTHLLTRQLLGPLVNSANEEVLRPDPLPVDGPKDGTNQPSPTPDVEEPQKYYWFGSPSALKTYVIPPLGTSSNIVAWDTPAIPPVEDKSPFAGLTDFTFGEFVFSAHSGQDEYPELRLGTMTAGPYKGRGIYVAYVDFCSPSEYCGEMGAPYYNVSPRYIKDGSKVIILTKNTPYDEVEREGLRLAAEKNKFEAVFDANLTIPELDFPETVSSGGVQFVRLMPSLLFGTKSVNPRVEFRDMRNVSEAEISPIGTIAFQDPKWGTAYNDRYGRIYFVMPDGSLIVYKTVPPAWLEEQVSAITWTDGSKNVNAYTSMVVTGCGVADGLDVVKVDPARVVRLGTHVVAGPVYAPADEMAALRDIYDREYYVPEGTKIPYEEFIKSHPLLYWQDGLGRYIQLKDVRYRIQAECAKPVIYLYPEETTDVSVKVAPTAGFTYTDPDYGSGWEVTAEPSGQLTQKGTGLPYPYLFWEGRAKEVWEMPQRGWVVPVAEVEPFLNKTLAQLGLNAQETKDFNEFWLPFFNGSPYYLITFSGNSVMDVVAPLTVEPKPDTVIRIMMDFQGLPAPISVPTPTIRTPERNGFTVVEWGGVKR